MLLDAFIRSANTSERPSVESWCDRWHVIIGTIEQMQLQQKVTAKNDPTDLLKRIDKQHGTHTIDHAAQIGLGSKKYELVNLE